MIFTIALVVRLELQRKHEVRDRVEAQQRKDHQHVPDVLWSEDRETRHRADDSLLAPSFALRAVRVTLPPFLALLVRAQRATNQVLLELHQVTKIEGLLEEPLAREASEQAQRLVDFLDDRNVEGHHSQDREHGNREDYREKCDLHRCI